MPPGENDAAGGIGEGGVGSAARGTSSDILSEDAAAGTDGSGVASGARGAGSDVLSEGAAAGGRRRRQRRPL